MQPNTGGGRIEWPVSGWPRHGPLVIAFLVVLVALILALLFLGGGSAEDAPLRDLGVTAQPTDPE